jgi:hypothetical protein
MAETAFADAAAGVARASARALAPTRRCNFIFRFPVPATFASGRGGA